MRSLHPDPRVAVILLAAGRGERLGRGMPKAAVPLCGKLMLEWALQGVLDAAVAARICVVVPPGASALANLCYRVQSREPSVDVQVVWGGTTRSESVACALGLLSADVKAVLVHDAARPLTPSGIFRQVADAVLSGFSAVVPEIGLSDSVKKVVVQHDALYIGESIDRSHLRRVQTPQGFDAEIFRLAYRHAEERGSLKTATDDASLIEALNVPIVLLPGSEQSLKITTSEDLFLAEALCSARCVEFGAKKTSIPSESLRVGIGVDVHAYATDASPLMLGGLYWPNEGGLAGHSDGDVVTHAVCDALLSAAGLGDMGEHFGTDREEYRGASSIGLLAKVVRLLETQNFRVINVAVQLMAQKPRFAPRRQEVERLLSRSVDAPVTVSATTSDGLGLVGRQEGAAAIATAAVLDASI